VHILRTSVSIEAFPLSVSFNATGKSRTLGSASHLLQMSKLVIRNALVLSRALIRDHRCTLAGYEVDRFIPRYGVVGLTIAAYPGSFPVYLFVDRRDG
jgi:hypothetical protein